MMDRTDRYFTYTLPSFLLRSTSIVHYYNLYNPIHLQLLSLSWVTCSFWNQSVNMSSSVCSLYLHSWVGWQEKPLSPASHIMAVWIGQDKISGGIFDSYLFMRPYPIHQRVLLTLFKTHLASNHLLHVHCHHPDSNHHPLPGLMGPSPCTAPLGYFQHIISCDSPSSSQPSNHT